VRIRTDGVTYTLWAFVGVWLAFSGKWAPPTLLGAIFKYSPLFLIGGMVVIAAMVAMSKTAHETGTLQSANAVNHEPAPAPEESANTKREES
jgi:hypothetical protein